MKSVRMIQTSDGVLHENYLKAGKHANKRYGDALTSLAHRLVQIDKYKAMLEFLDVGENLEEFVRLKALKGDLILEPEEED